jgi:alpha-L-fucosidase
MKWNPLPLLLLLAVALSAQEAPNPYIPESDPAAASQIEKWRDLKFGLLMHWGPYSQWGVVESWSICPEDEGWCQRSGPFGLNYWDYKRAYEKLQTTFNPQRFDPRKWALAARDAGMKYVVFTTKHHDGFCMFNAPGTDYTITAPGCPFSTDPRADVTRAIFDAFRNQGLWAGAYFSKPDWHSDDYWWSYFPPRDRHVNYDPRKYPQKWQRFVAYTHEQVRAILTRYGRVDILWLDGGWVRPRPETSGSADMRPFEQDIDMPGLARMARQLQPGIIIVDRDVPGPYQNYLTPENQVPPQVLPYPWESCMIMGGGWSYSPDATLLPVRTLIHMLVDIVAKGGNLLLNIGPGPDGTWYPEAYSRLHAIGDWLRRNGAAIYGSRPLPPHTTGPVRLTRGKDGTQYAIYLADEGQTTLPARIALDGFQPLQGSRATLLGTARRLALTITAAGCTVAIPADLQRQPPGSYAWVICFK